MAVFPLHLVTWAISWLGLHALIAKGYTNSPQWESSFHNETTVWKRALEGNREKDSGQKSKKWTKDRQKKSTVAELGNGTRMSHHTLYMCAQYEAYGKFTLWFMFISLKKKKKTVFDTIAWDILWISLCLNAHRYCIWNSI